MGCSGKRVLTILDSISQQLNDGAGQFCPWPGLPALTFGALYRPPALSPATEDRPCQDLLSARVSGVLLVAVQTWFAKSRPSGNDEGKGKSGGTGKGKRQKAVGRPDASAVEPSQQVRMLVLVLLL